MDFCGLGTRFKELENEIPLVRAQEIMREKGRSKPVIMCPVEWCDCPTIVYAFESI
jgi:hypothetical protein